MSCHSLPYPQPRSSFPNPSLSFGNDTISLRPPAALRHWYLANRLFLRFSCTSGAAITRASADSDSVVGTFPVFFLASPPVEKGIVLLIIISVCLSFSSSPPHHVIFTPLLPPRTLFQFSLPVPDDNPILVVFD